MPGRRLKRRAGGGEEVSGRGLWRGLPQGRAGRPGDAVLITGSATGLGLETALQLAADGFRVFASVRSEESRERVLAAAAARGVTLEVPQLDLRDRASIERTVAEVLEAAGGLYALVNNGGIGLRGCLEDCSEEEIRALFETNVIGTILLTRAVLPSMRRAGHGRVVTISSVAGRVCGWGVTMYCATKWAQEALGEGLAQELAPFGIQSILVEPGIIKTERWQEHRGGAAAASDPASPYHGMFWASEAIADKIVERSPTKPADVARAVSQALTSPQPRLRYIVGRGARIVISLRRHLPPDLFERLYFGGHIRRVRRRAGAAQAPAPQAPAAHAEHADHADDAEQAGAAP